MRCTKCGASNKDTAKFCVSCGNSLQETTDKISEEINTKETKQSTKNFAVIGVAIIGIIVLLCIAFNFNAIKRSITSPQKYYQQIARKEVSENAKVYAEILDVRKNRNFDAKVSVELGKSIMETLEEVAYASIGTDEVKFLKNIGVTYSQNIKDKNIALKSGITLGGNSVISMNASLMTDKSLKAFVQIPELSNKYLGVDFDDIDVDIDELNESLEILFDVYDNLPDKKVIKKLMEKYGEIFVSQAKEVSKSTETIDAGDVSEKCYLYTVEFDDDELAELAGICLKELKADKDVEQIVKNLAALAELDQYNRMDSDIIWDEFVDWVDDSIDELESIFSGYEMSIGLYVDKAGEVRGTSVVWRYGSEKIEYTILAPISGKRVGLEIEIKADGERFVLSGEGTKAGDLVSGQYTLKISTEREKMSVADISVEKLNISKLKEGKLEGVIEIRPSKIIVSTLKNNTDLPINLSEIALKISGKETDKKCEQSYSIVNGKDEYITLKVDIEYNAEKNISAPNSKDVIWISDEIDFEEYIDSINVDHVLKTLEKAGVPDIILDEFDLDKNIEKTKKFKDTQSLDGLATAMAVAVTEELCKANSKFRPGWSQTFVAGKDVISLETMKNKDLDWVKGVWEILNNQPIRLECKEFYGKNVKVSILEDYRIEIVVYKNGTSGDTLLKILK